MEEGRGTKGGRLFLSNLQRVGPGPEKGDEQETETNRLKEKLTLGITQNQGVFPIQGMRVPLLEVCKDSLCQRGVSTLRNPLTSRAPHLSNSL